MTHPVLLAQRRSKAWGALCATLDAAGMAEAAMRIEARKEAERRDVALLAERVQQESRAALALRDEVLTEARA